MTDSHPNEETARRTEAESSSKNVDGDAEFDSTARSESSNTGSLSRRGALALVTALGLGGVATGNASAASGDHLGELWDGSPGTGRGLETVLREKGQALKGTAGTNTDDTNDIGVKGTTYSTRGIGLEGLAAASSGNTIGLKGRTDSPDGTALFGEARNSNPGSSLAVEGLSRAEDGIAIQGHAEAAGDTIGVEGRVDSSDGYGLATPDDARIEGVIDTNETDFVVDAGTQSTGHARNVVTGHASNAAQEGAVGATISGGGSDNGSTVESNEVYDNYGTVGGGTDNLAGSIDGDPTTDQFATVAGGESNTASGNAATVGGGSGNGATGVQATVGGGFLNRASETQSTVGGGDSNIASGEAATIGGGQNNEASAEFATVAGGGPARTSDPLATNNVVYDNYGTIGGGGNNQAGTDDGNTTSAWFATVGGGKSNTASGDFATVGGGRFNDASEFNATVGGGDGNIASATKATVGGGDGNTASGLEATVGGGFENTASGGSATVPGGSSNTASGDNSFAAGGSAGAYHDRTFVWSDSALFGSTDSEQFLVHADGGVGIQTDSPQSQLHVTDSVTGPADSLGNNVATVENTSSNGDGDVLAVKVNDSDPDQNQNFVTFFDADTVVGRIEGTGGGVNYASGFGDLAEYFPKADPEREFAPGEVVGLRDGQVVSSVADGDAAFVVSTAPMVTGNAPPEGEADRYVRLALVGQVPVMVSSPVESGDVLVASRADDGTAVAREGLDREHIERPVVGLALDDREGPEDTVSVLIGTGGNTQPPDAAQRSTRLDVLKTENERLRADLDTKDERIEEVAVEADELRGENEQLQGRVSAVEDRNEVLEAENERLHERLRTVEDRLAEIEAGESAATAADD